MKTSIKYQLTEAEYATREGCSVRTIRNWKRDRAPLDDLRRLATWKASRKHLPIGTQAAVDAVRVEKQAKALARLPVLPQGAAHALARLEQAEAEAFNRLRASLAENDPSEIKLAREHWLRIGDSLRRYELLIEQNRRVTGQLVPKDEVQDAVARLAWWCRIIGQQLADALIARIEYLPRDGEFSGRLGAIIKDGFLEQFLSGLIQAINAPRSRPFPQWLKDAFLKDMRQAHSGIDEKVRGRLAIVAALTEFQAAQIMAKQTGNRPDENTLFQLLEKHLAPEREQKELHENQTHADKNPTGATPES